jgi:hypothetical protein
MYAYSPALEAPAPIVFLVWIQAWVGVILVMVIVAAVIVVVAGMVVLVMIEFESRI